jgi:hypothetical protein
MKRLLVTCIAAAAISACGSDSGFPTATGKASIWAINAIPTSPEIGFFIEERTIGAVNFKDNTVPGVPRDWDDLAYTFHFEAIIPPEPGTTRIASQPLDVVRDMDYIFLVWGQLAAPVVSIWEKPQRTFDGTETSFEFRVGHAAESLGTVDIYYALEGVAPVLGEQFATLEPGEVSATADFESDSYVVTVTAQNDPSIVHFQSVPSNVLAAQSVVMPIFEGDANDTSPYVAKIINMAGQSVVLADARGLPTARYVHATMDLATSDIYDDVALNNQIVANLAFGDATGDIDMTVGDAPLTFTAAGNPGAILYETTLTNLLGIRVNFYMSVDTVVNPGSLIGVRQVVDRRSIETVARFTFFHSAINNQEVDLYIVDSGETIDERLPRQIQLPYRAQSPALALGEGSFDVYVTTSGEKTILDGPIPLDTVLGGVYEAVLLDRVDPTLAELRILPPP